MPICKYDGGTDKSKPNCKEEKNQTKEHAKPQSRERDGEERTVRRRTEGNDRMANRERNKKKHAERGNINIVVANVTPLHIDWLVLVKQKAYCLALTEVRVRQREILVIRTQLHQLG